MTHCYFTTLKNFYSKKITVFSLILFLTTLYGFSQTFTDTTPNNNETFTVPPNVFSLTVQCWGAGGGGGGDNQNNGVDGAGGGAGGSYASSIIAVTPGQILTYNVGAGGAAGSNGNGGTGNPTWFSAVGTLYAQGGAGGQSAQNGRAGGTGSIAATIGTTRTAGSNGANGSTTVGGRGGNGANPGGGAGGAQRTTEGPGLPGTAPGGGGGGSYTPGNPNQIGGVGGNGQLVITYSTCAQPTINATTAITATTATINWSAPGSGTTPTGYEYVVSTTSTAPVGAGTADAASPANITGLSANTTYYIFIRTNCGGGTFSSWAGPRTFTTPNGVSNDEPCGAIALSSGCTGGTNVASTPTTVSPINVAGCGSHSGNEDDVWYTYVVGASGSFEIEAQLGSMTDPVIAIYSGTCSGALNLIQCDDDSGPSAGFASYILITGQTPGTTLYIRVWRYNQDIGTGSNGTFTLCINDIENPCSNIVNIPDCGSTTINATIDSGSGAFNDSCFDTPGDEQIYSFTPTVTGSYNITQLSTFGHINYAFNTVCGSSGWTCIDDLTGNNQDSSFFSLNAGTTYYIMLDSETSAGGNVSFTLNCPPPVPPNDLCNNAFNLNCGDSDIVGSTNSTTNVAHGTACSVSNYGVWYTFIGNGDQVTIFTDADDGFNHELSISSGNCGTLTNIACINTSPSGGTESYTFITTVGERYFVFVAHQNPASLNTGNFTISLNCTPVIPPPNDDPCNATDLIVNASCVPTVATNEFATNTTGVVNPSCGNTSYQGGDVWFTVTVPPSPGAAMTIETQAGVVNNSGMAVYTGTLSCPSGTPTLTEIACSNGGNGLMASISLNNASNGIVPGQTLYIRVWETGNDNNGSFSICVTAPTPSNFDVEICQGDSSEAMATDLFCYNGGVDLGSGATNVITGNILSSAPSAPRPPWFLDSVDPCSFTGPSRRYHIQTFTVSSTGTYTFTADGPATSLTDTMGYIYDVSGTTSPGTCGSGYIAGDDDSGVGLYSEIIAFLQASVTYALVTTTATGTETGNYEWDVDVAAESAQWFTTATGGTPVGYGSYFDPVNAGIISDTNTPGTTSFWVGCEFSTDPRVETFFTIKPRPTATISGSATGGACGSYDITITGSDPNASFWDFEYSTDGGVTTQWIYFVTSPHTFTATEPSGTVYTLIDAVSDGDSIGCSALPSGLTGSATVTTTSTTWDGSTNSDWFNASNWSTNAVPTSGDCVIIPNTANDPVINGTSDADAGSVTIQNGGYLFVTAGGTITIQNDLTINTGGTFELEGVNGAADGSTSSISASLIQVNDTNNVVDGTFILDRATYVRTRDYVYWSAPVENYAMTSIVNTQYILEWEQTIGSNAPSTHGNWANPAETTMIEGKGYAIQGRPQGNGDDDTAAWNTVSFNGVPHNGLVTIPLIRGNYTGTDITNPNGSVTTEQDDNWNLVGNPYPSALSADDFLTVNAQANNRIEGTVYLWTHGTKIRRGNSPFFGDYVFNYDITDYTEYNLMGSTGGFSGFIGSGQGFFVLMDDASASGTNLEFDNSMRNRTYENTVMFFRESGANRDSNFEYERHRIWLDIVEPSLNVSTILMGYMEGATNEKDKMYDAVFMNGSNKKIYTIIDGSDKKFSIQGRALPFQESDVIPLGIIIDQLGEYVINIQEVDGLFGDDTQEIFIEDLELGVIHSLKEGPYVFTATEMGEFTDRFQIRFTSNALSVNEFNSNSGISIIAPNSEYIKITSSNDTIDSVSIYDLLGRNLLSRQNINSQELVLNNISQSDGVLMVQVILTNGQQKIQKVVLR